MIVISLVVISIIIIISSSSRSTIITIYYLLFTIYYLLFTITITDLPGVEADKAKIVLKHNDSNQSNNQQPSNSKL